MDRDEAIYLSQVEMHRAAALAERDAAYAQLRECWYAHEWCPCGAQVEMEPDTELPIVWPKHAPDCPTAKALAQDA